MTRIDIVEIDREEAEPIANFPMDPTRHRELYRGQTTDTYIFYAGLEEVAPGIGEVWIKYMVDPKDYPLAFIMTKQLVDRIMGSGNYHRLQSTVLEDSPSVNYDKHLGFHIEGKLEHYVDNRTHLVMARFK